MIFKELTEILDQHQEAELYIMLPSGNLIPEHFHVTEVGRVQKKFIDCGGTFRETTSCLLQTWTAHDIDHRLVAGKLAKILNLGHNTLDLNELSVEIEYGSDVASQYEIAEVKVISKGLLFLLNSKRTDCLAPDKCGVNQCTVGCC